MYLTRRLDVDNKAVLGLHLVRQPVKSLGEIPLVLHGGAEFVG